MRQNRGICSDLDAPDFHCVGSDAGEASLFVRIDRCSACIKDPHGMCIRTSEYDVPHRENVVEQVLFCLQKPKTKGVERFFVAGDFQPGSGHARC